MSMFSEEIFLNGSKSRQKVSKYVGMEWTGYP